VGRFYPFRLQHYWGYSRAMTRTRGTLSARNFGLAWFFFSVVFALHIWDEAVHDFTGYYNSTVLTIYGHFSWFPRIDLGYRTWLTTHVLANLFLFSLTPFAFRNARWLRPLAYAATCFGLAIGIGHVLVTIRGYTVPSVVFEGVSPGFYTSPLLLMSTAYLFWSLRKGLTRVPGGSPSPSP
jgi:hypothetical protein